MSGRDGLAEQGSVRLQKAVDSVFHGEEFPKLKLSITIADPLQEDYPLIACSEGFCQLTGYSVQETIGRNCRFLLSDVPTEFIDDEMRVRCRHYMTVASGKSKETCAMEVAGEFLHSGPWMTACQSSILCVQTNTSKTGELFNNMFFMSKVDLSRKTYTMGLHAHLPEKWRTTMEIHKLEVFCKQIVARLCQDVSGIEAALPFFYGHPLGGHEDVRALVRDLAMQAGIGLATILCMGWSRDFLARGADELDFEAGSKWPVWQLSSVSTMATLSRQVTADEADVIDLPAR